jgi:hypothetical protein
MSNGAASGAAMDPVGDSAKNKAKVAGTDAVGGDAAAIAARAKQAKRAKVGMARGISTFPASKNVDSMILWKYLSSLPHVFCGKASLSRK